MSVGCNKTVSKDFIYCLNFATEAHRNQKRKDPEKTPYIIHPIGVAFIVTGIAGVTNLDLLRGCLLHDTVEDTPVTIETIHAEFGTYVGNLVQEVTDDKNLPKQKRKELQVIHAKTSSPQAKLVKLADKLYNLQDLQRSLPEGWTEERREEYFAWACQVWQGLRGLCPPLDHQLATLFAWRGLTIGQEQSSSSAEMPSWETHGELRPLIMAAYLSAKRHSQHFVFDVPGGTPYINHVVSTAFILSQDCDVQDVPTLCAALLKDVVGKARCPLEQIISCSGDEGCQLVYEISYDHSLPIVDQFKYLMMRAETMSHSAKMICLASLLDGCRRLGHAPSPSTEFRQQYCSGATQLATRLSGTHPHLEHQLSLA